MADDDQPQEAGPSGEPSDARRAEHGRQVRGMQALGKAAHPEPLKGPRQRLMGLPEEYVLPNNYNEAYHLAGDGVAVPVVSFLATRIFEPILASALAGQKAA